MPVPVSALRSAREIKTLAESLAKTATAQATNPRTEMRQLLEAATDDAERARIQRAIESGRTKIGYHGTVTDFPEIDPDKVDLGLHVGSPEQASVRLQNLIQEKKLPYFWVNDKKVAEGAQINPIAYDPGKTLEVKRDVGSWNDAVSVLSQMYGRMPNDRLNQEMSDLLEYYEEIKDRHVAGQTQGDPEWHLTDSNRQGLNDIRDVLRREGYGTIRYPNEVENLGGHQAGMLPAAEYEASELINLKSEIEQAARSRMPPKIEPPETSDPDAAAKVEAYLNQKIPDPRNFMEPEEIDTFHNLTDRYNLLTNDPSFRNDPYSYIILNPPKARSINAEFDPLYKTSPDLMKADGGLVSLADKYQMQRFAGGGLASHARQWLKGYPEKSLSTLKLQKAETPEAAALNNWIDTSLTNYIKRDYGAPHDPLSSLAPEQRHIPLLGERARAIQANAVWPPKGFGERVGLPEVSSATINYLLDPLVRKKSAVDELLAENPWVASLPKETMVYSDVSPHVLGLQHLRDELHNAIRPDSGLPDYLRLKPESLPRVSVAQASQLVGKINAWRAENMAKANLARSMNPATFIHKEYPEQNMRWVQLRAPDELKALPEGYSIGPSSDMSRQSGRYVLRYPLGDEAPLGNYATEQEAIDKALRMIQGDDRFEQLQDALKYEGDTMGHCVGGYCDSVFDGNSKIYSLRDASGQPHVTVEVENDNWISGEAMDELVPGSFDEYLGQKNSPDGIGHMHDFIREKYPDMYDMLTRPSITQIKGKGNRAPVDKYLPFVQDFVKSQKWANIGDIGNTGLRRTADAFNPNEMAKIKAAGIEIPEYATQAEIDEINSKVWPVSPAPSEQGDITGMKSGGKVKSKPNSMAILDALAGSSKDKQAPWPAQADFESAAARALRRAPPPGLEDIRRAARSKRSGIELLESVADLARAGATGFGTMTSGILPGSEGVKYSAAKDPNSLMNRDDREMPAYFAAMASLPAVVDMMAPGMLPEDIAEFSRRVGAGYGDMQELALAKRGLPSYEDMSFPQRVMFHGGEMLAQIPVGAAKVASKAPAAIKAVTAAPKAIAEYLGPTISPSVGNYVGGAFAGAALPDLIRKYMEITSGDAPINESELPKLAGTKSFEDRVNQTVSGELNKRQIEDSIIRSLVNDGIYHRFAEGGPVKMGGGGLAKKVEQAIKSSEAAGRKVVQPGKIGFDERFDPRVNEQEKIGQSAFHYDEPSPVEKKQLSIFDMEGRPFILGMADRTAAGKSLTGINDVQFDQPVKLLGGQDYMHITPGQVWAADNRPVSAMMKAAKDLAAETGKHPLFLPFRMSPKGGDYSTMTSDAMLSYARNNMTKKGIREANREIKSVFPEFLGVENPQSMLQLAMAGGDVRKQFLDVMDKKFRDAGSLNVGQARLAVTDPEQYMRPDVELQNVGEIEPFLPRFVDIEHPTYAQGIPGRGLGVLQESGVSAFDLLPKMVGERGVNIANPDPKDIYTLRLGVQRGIITDQMLRQIRDRLDAAGKKKGGRVKKQKPKTEKA